MKPIILIDENIPLLAEALEPALNGASQIIHYPGRMLPMEKLGKCEALFVRSVTRVDEGILADTNIVFVGTATSGLEHVDTEYLRRQNIRFVDAQGCNANSVAEYVVYAMLEWAEARQTSLRGRSIGIVGFGNIGTRVADYAHRLGMTVLVNDPPLKAKNIAFPEYVDYTEFDDLVNSADVVTAHVPFKRDGKNTTLGMFGEAEYARMKDGALFIHTSRRLIASESALLPHLYQKRLYAAIDVWEQEPLVNRELAGLCLLATPHVAGYTFEGKINGSRIMAEKYGEFFGVKPDMSIFERAVAREHAIIPDFDDQNGLKELLRESRRLDEDTDMLLETLATPEHQHQVLFDKLRKNYPLRREILR